MNHDRCRRDDQDRKFLMSRRWREKIRPQWLAQRPLCEHCTLLGRVTIATEIDHVIPPRGDRALQEDPENFQSLCGDHHKAKSGWERRGRRGPLIIGFKPDGYAVELPNGRVERDGGDAFSTTW